MAESVSVNNSEEIERAKAICRLAVRKLEEASIVLEMDYEKAGTGWQDSKYDDLGELVGQCVAALREPVKELETCYAKLDKLLEEVKRYEAVKL